MEHLLLTLFVDGVLAFDRCFQRPLKAVVAEFEELLDRPADLLRRQDVIIGPRRRFATATVLGAVSGLGVSCGLCGWFLDHLAQPHNRPVPLHEVFIPLAGFLLPIVLGVWLAERLLRGGQMVLREEGVLLRYRRDRVFCPWAVFMGQGEARPHDWSRWLIPTAEAARPSVVYARDGTVIATGLHVSTKPLSFRSDGQIFLYDLYSVSLRDLAPLLLHLGKRIGPGQKLQPPPERGAFLPEGM